MDEGTVQSLFERPLIPTKALRQAHVRPEPDELCMPFGSAADLPAPEAEIIVEGSAYGDGGGGDMVAGAATPARHDRQRQPLPPAGTLAGGQPWTEVAPRIMLRGPASIYVK